MNLCVVGAIHKRLKMAIPCAKHNFHNPHVCGDLLPLIERKFMCIVYGLALSKGKADVTLKGASPDKTCRILQTCARMKELTEGIQNHIGFMGSFRR